MDSELAEALCMVSATHELGHFSGDPPLDLQTLMSALTEADILTCEDFRIAFVSANMVSETSVKSFAVDKLACFEDVVAFLAEELIPEGYKGPGGGLRKRRVPMHNVGGRLVFRRLEECWSRFCSQCRSF